MNPEIKEKWLTALRSGEYVKGQDVLKRTTGENEFAHCCLGVLCEIHLKETGEGDWSSNNCYITKNGNERDWLPKEVMNWSGIEDARGSFTPSSDDKLSDHLRNKISGPNLTVINDIKKDNKGYDPTFSTVIEYIEKYF